MTSDVSRRKLICGGGAGFVSALVDMLVGNGQTARAQGLGARVPEVDRLAVTIVTDTQIIKFIPTEKHNGLTIERRPAGNVRPDAPPRADLLHVENNSLIEPSRFTTKPTFPDYHILLKHASQLKPTTTSSDHRRPTVLSKAA
jgi:7,8-dihydropterin-6-yl-methyl-4-(beta-D-ribofuranosyl)aminobenzene 5'-phosphate synthase